MRMQERDIDILQALFSYRMLTTSQLTQLFFTSKKRAEQRLRQLYDAGLVERIFRLDNASHSQVDLGKIFNADLIGNGVYVRCIVTDRCRRVFRFQVFFTIFNHGVDVLLFYPYHQRFKFVNVMV